MNAVMIKVISRTVPLAWIAALACSALVPLRTVVVLASLAASATIGGAIGATHEQRRILARDECIDMLLQALLATRPRGHAVRVPLRAVR